MDGVTEQFPIAQLEAKGLLLQAALPLATLAEELKAPLIAAGLDLASFQTLVLMGQAGPRFFEQTVSASREQADPFDAESIRLVADWFATNSPAAKLAIVYPGDIALNLGQLAELGGWGKPSPLGLTIHPEYGLWNAHRVAFLTDIAWDCAQPNRAHPCDTCEAKPCEAACPAKAVSLSDGFDVVSCTGQRAPAGSECEFRCSSREACPVGSEYRYGPIQMKHHYSSGLKSIRQYLQR